MGDPKMRRRILILSSHEQVTPQIIFCTMLCTFAVCPPAWFSDGSISKVNKQIKIRVELIYDDHMRLIGRFFEERHITT